MNATGIPIAARLAECHLDDYPWHTPDAPVPFNLAIRFLAIVASRDDVPDLGFRAATARTLAQTPMTVEVGGIAYSPRQWFERASRLMPNYCTHLRMELAGSAEAVSAHFEGRLDPLGLHLAHQHVAMAVKLFAEGDTGRSALAQVEIAPPLNGSVESLETWFQCRTNASRDNTLRLSFRPGVLDRLISPSLTRQLPILTGERWRSLYGRDALVDATRYDAAKRVTCLQPRGSGHHLDRALLKSQCPFTLRTR